MRITHITAHNWRNFKNIDFDLDDRLFVVGPNASGKSNLLDLMRFLTDLCRPGGGLAAALAARGGLSKARSLFSRNHKHGRLVIEVHLVDAAHSWKYRLAVGSETRGHHRPLVQEEVVERNGETLLQRPNRDDESDPERLTQTHLEQIAANQAFRAVADHLAKTTYFHLVPQVIRHPQQSSTSTDASFGSSMIADMNATPQRTRDAWLRRIQGALTAAVPGFESLSLEVDPAGKPHLVAGYRNWRQAPARQDETDFSDGTLRLIGLLWTIVSAPANGGVLLLEEPELSLNSAVVRVLPTLLALAQRDANMQVIITTHSPELLDDEGVAAEEVLVLQVTDDGTRATPLDRIPDAGDQLAAELPLSDVVEQLIAPESLTGLLSAVRR
ncbi:AAA family ATPase [Aestuariimicrobium sp. Y1814]|uniref:AAA family ATPase n=1 Tax=Aestuariimicrobium sp. Y1814 TaxID=3418742 RepID=UPI003DA6FFA1